MSHAVRNLTSKTALIAVIALVVCAVGGGTAVAGKLITGKNVKNSSLTGADIKSSSITSSDIKNGSVGTNDLSSAAKSTIKGEKGDPGTHGPLAYAQYENNTQTDSTSFVPVTNMVTQVNVPANASKVLIDFSAECSITHASAKRTMYVQILVDGVATTVGSQAFCSNVPGSPDDQLYMGSSMQRVQEVTPGVHTVEVQFRASGADATAKLDETTLSVQTGS